MKVCKSCGIEERTQYCESCRSYLKSRPLFLKLSIVEKNLQLAYKEALQKLYKEYFQLNKSMLMIQKEFGINLNTLHKFFKKNNISFRTISEGNTNSIINNGRIVSYNFKFCKNGWHTTWDERKVFLRSSYEFLLAEKLDAVKEYYEVEFIRLKYFSKEGKEKIYISDFYLPKRNLIIETKSEYSYEVDKEDILLKKEVVLKNGYFFQLMFKKDIEDFNIGF